MKRGCLKCLTTFTFITTSLFATQAIPAAANGFEPPLDVQDGSVVSLIITFLVVVNTWLNIRYGRDEKQRRKREDEED